MTFSRNFTTRIAIAFVGIACSVSTLAQETTDPSTAATKLTNEILKQRLMSACDESALPGMWAGRFCTGEQSAIVEAAGKRSWSASDLAQADDIVHLVSCTIAMTATIILQPNSVQTVG